MLGEIWKIWRRERSWPWTWLFGSSRTLVHRVLAIQYTFLKAYSPEPQTWPSLVTVCCRHDTIPEVELGEKCKNTCQRALWEIKVQLQLLVAVLVADGDLDAWSWLTRQRWQLESWSSFQWRLWNDPSGQPICLRTVGLPLQIVILLSAPIRVQAIG